MTLQPWSANDSGTFKKILFVAKEDTCVKCTNAGNSANTSGRNSHAALHGLWPSHCPGARDPFLVRVGNCAEIGSPGARVSHDIV
eukprot:CAMPEP_0204460636 /NCGR_PEP_ID=MMETSP0471-20130131/4866_1 /ASSEMBLY_ACC=CAM_ASM_000602 /TAXON_ID=2969 /ORGANISM="Oxyrrhis marina" /LENGTH=84 /DNA_ID=CAMNT_0051461515 /DNA_START=431 /DNA_END=681 /DNA_ORIENTATION=-